MTSFQNLLYPNHVEFFDESFSEKLFHGQLVQALAQLQLEILAGSPKTVKLPTPVQLRYLLSYAALPNCMFKQSGQYTSLKSTSLSQQVIKQIRKLMDLAGVGSRSSDTSSSNGKLVIDTARLVRFQGASKKVGPRVNISNFQDKKGSVSQDGQSPSYSSTRAASMEIDNQIEDDKDVEPVQVFYALLDVLRERTLPNSWQTLEIAPFQDPENLPKHRGGVRRNKGSTLERGRGNDLDEKDFPKHHMLNLEKTENDEDYELQMLGLDGDVDQKIKDQYIYKVTHTKEESGSLETSNPAFHRLYAEDLLYTWGGKFKDDTHMPLPNHSSVMDRIPDTRTPERLSIGFISWILQYSTQNTDFGNMRYSQLEPILDILLSILEHDTAKIESFRFTHEKEDNKERKGSMFSSFGESLPNSIFDSWVIEIFNSFSIGDSENTTTPSHLLPSSAVPRKHVRTARFHGSVKKTLKTAARLAKYFSTFVMSNQDTVSAQTILTFRLYLFPTEVRKYEEQLMKQVEEEFAEEEEREAKKRNKRKLSDTGNTLQSARPALKRKLSINKESKINKQTLSTPFEPSPNGKTSKKPHRIAFGDSLQFRVRLINLIISSWSHFCFTLFRESNSPDYHSTKSLFPQHLVQRLFSRASTKTVEHVLCSSLLSFEAREALVTAASSLVLGMRDIYDEKALYDVLISDLSVLPGGSLASPLASFDAATSSFSFSSSPTPHMTSSQGSENGSALVKASPSSSFSKTFSKEAIELHYQYLIVLKALIIHFRRIDDEHLQQWINNIKHHNSLNDPADSVNSTHSIDPTNSNNPNDSKSSKGSKKSKGSSTKPKPSPIPKSRKYRLFFEAQKVGQARRKELFVGELRNKKMMDQIEIIENQISTLLNRR